MLIHPFAAGVIATILFEILVVAAFFGVAVYRQMKNNRK